MPVSSELKSLGAKTIESARRGFCLDGVSSELPSHFGRRTPLTDPVRQEIDLIFVLTRYVKRLTTI